MYVKSFVLVAIAIFNSACASRYLEPQEGELAALEMPVKHVKVGIGANSSIYLFAIKEEGSSCGKVFKPLGPKNRGDKTATVNIPADREIFVANSSSIGSYSFCNVAGSFKSAQNKKYKLT
ncbi:hypothetical protein [Microbulbifer variabilis]|uniref:hypothetical protein n=1 Tax=Microbulbifer variabilis TaxID=266805 RepID=UPI001CFEB1B7|nr:hypothetical protein [Microbulbifer variabilis]